MPQNEYGEEVEFWFERLIPRWAWRLWARIQCRRGKHHWMSDIDPRLDSWCSACRATQPQVQTPERLLAADEVNAVIERTVGEFNAKLARGEIVP